ncbi:hypothetical protein [Streptomyces sp. NPDC056683]|uniref:hypothetical protein n=1 Tax=Streptomyces sp. NPDC056683 TaxID=3345910 RepID=UPI0036AD1AB5
MHEVNGAFAARACQSVVHGERRSDADASCQEQERSVLLRIDDGIPERAGDKDLFVLAQGSRPQ